MSKQNPFRAFEQGAKKFGNVALVVLWILIGVFMLIALPIIGLVVGAPLHAAFIGWIFVGFVALIILVFVGISWVWEKTVAEWWYQAKVKWDRENRD